MPSSLEHWPWKAQDITQEAHDVIQLHICFGRHHGNLAHVAGWRIPRRANVFLQEAAFSLKMDNITLEGE
jgi:hypothetical protein